MGNAWKAKAALTKAGFRFAHSLGQNFLLDDEWICRIADAAGAGDGDHVLEIGAGAGVLTHELAMRGCHVLALELDESLEAILYEVLEGARNVRLVFADGLKADLASLAREEFGAGQSFRVVANLPYYITTDILLKLLKSRAPIDRITVLVQREAAERILSQPGDAGWCALSAIVQYFGRPEALFDVPPRAFTPPPHVTSTLLQIELHQEKPHQALHDASVMALIQCAFAMRRKTLQNNMIAHYSMSKPHAQALLEAAGLDPRVRGESLTIRQLVELADLIHCVKELR